MCACSGRACVLCVYSLFSPKGASFFPSSLLFAFIPLLNRLAHSLYYTCFRTEVKNCIAGIAGDRERETKRRAQSEKMKKQGVWGGQGERGITLQQTLKACPIIMEIIGGKMARLRKCKTTKGQRPLKMAWMDSTKASGTTTEPVDITVSMSTGRRSRAWADVPLCYFCPITNFMHLA